MMKSAVIVGYYQSYKRYTTCANDEINPALCTHLIYAFAGVKHSRLRVIDQWGDVDSNGYKSFGKLRKAPSKPKVLLAVGGWEEPPTQNFSKMVASSETRQVFIDSCLEFLDEYGYSGIDLDWEFPADIARGGRPEDKKNFTSLVKEMHKALAPRGYMLTVAVGAGKSTIDTYYQPAKIAAYVDHIHLMTYDYHSAADGSKVVGHNAPLYSADEANINSSVKAWIAAGVPPAKLVLGIPAYGRSYTLASANKTAIGSPAKGPGTTEPVDYTEVLKLQVEGGWTVVWDSFQEVPYMYKGTQWIGYDDPRSVERKVAYAKRMGLGGVMVWSIDSDHPRGGAMSYPLLRTINNKL